MVDLLTADSQPEPGDTVIELRDGVPYIYTAGAATAAAWDDDDEGSYEDVTDQLAIDPRDVQPGDTVIEMPNGVLWWQPGTA